MKGIEVLKIGTLFSGGLAAVEWAMKYEEFEHEVVFACEWDKYARKQYLEFHGEPSSCFYEDVSDMSGTKYFNTIDLMVWGSPCQDLSLAGKRKGFDGEKSSLFREGARIMSEVMPKAFIFENVKGLLSSNGGADYKEVEKTFREMGYHMAMKVVNAKEQGTAQNRERVFVVGFLDEDDYHNFSFADSVPLTKVLRDYLEYDVDEKYYLSQKMIDGFIMKNERYEKEGKAKGFTFAPADVDSHSSCLNARYYKMGAADIYIQDEPKLNQVGELDIKGSESLRRVYGTDGLCPTMTKMGGGGNRQPKVLLPTLELGVKKIKPKDATTSSHIFIKSDNTDYSVKAIYQLSTDEIRIEYSNGSVDVLYDEFNSEDFYLFEYIDTEVRAKILDFTNSFGEDKIREYSNVCPALRSERSGLCVTEPKIYQTGRGYNKGGEKDICPTITINSWEHNNHLIDSFRIRRLIPLECGLLMGMRKEDIKIVVSDTQAYKIFGNGIEINSISSIVRQLYRPVKSIGSLF